MPHKIRVISIMLILLISFIPSIMVVSAQNITITPTFFDITGDVGSWVMKNVIVHNNGVADVGITVSSSMDGCMIPSPATVVPAGGERTISIVFVIKKIDIGWVTFTTGSEQFNQLISIKPNKINASVMMFPTNPKGGDTLSFLLMNNVVRNANGYLVCTTNGNNYLINIVDGIGSVKLNESDYGQAYYYISSDTIEPISKDFTILGGVADNNTTTPSVITIDGPATGVVGNCFDYSIFQDGKLLFSQPIRITNPAGASSNENTGYFGSLSICFNMTGTWKLLTLKDEITTTKNVVVTKTQKTISLATKNPSVDTEVAINVFSNAVVTITDSEGNLQDVVVLGETASFTPSSGGQYQVTAESSEAYANPLVFTVKTTIDFRFVESGTGRQTSTVQKGKGYYIRLVDYSSGDVVDLTGETITVTNIENNEKDTIELYETGGYWRPSEAGEYSISYNGGDTYLKTLMQRTVSLGIVVNTENSSSLPWGWIIFGLILVIVCMLLFRYRQFIPLFNGRWRRKKEGDVGKSLPPE